LLRAVNRSGAPFLLLCIVFTLFSIVNAGPQHQTPLWGFRQVAIFTATLVMGRAAVVAANDFTTGTIRAWLISSPGRRAIFAGKLGASATVGLLAAVVVGLAGYAASGLVGAVPAAPAMTLAIAQLALACVALSIFGHAVGVLTRSVPVALTVTIGWILPAEAVLQGHSRTLDRWLPGNVLQDFTLGAVAKGSTPLGAVVHATVPFIVLDAVALAFFLRRDVNS
jgi:ABC-type transport system involved in multi-copper enzyme maturation permease subunit